MTKNNESAVETTLDRMVREIGGITRKVKSSNVDGFPDRVVFFPAPMPPELRVWFVELKVLGGNLEAHQAREHNRLLQYTDNVITLAGRNQVEAFVANISVMIEGYRRQLTIPKAVIKRVTKHESIDTWPRRPR